MKVKRKKIATVKNQAKSKETLPGTLRIKTSDLCLYEKTKTSWERVPKTFPDATLVIKLFKANNRFEYLIDKKDPSFIKGQLSPEGKVQGARINILPNGKELDKAFSLFSPLLTIHDEKSNHHWNVIFKNPNGKFAYCYTKEKKEKFVTKKYKVVQEFGKYYPELEKNAFKALADEDDQFAVPMCTLLKTYMRVGNEMYYNENRHQGLTTLKKKDISIKGNSVKFSYIAKDGVPHTIIEAFPPLYVKRLRELLQETKGNSFVFINKQTGNPIRDVGLKDAFKRYCGKEFYPHIVRSYYATLRARKFLEEYKKPTKEDMRALFLSIAEKLGHKKFAKKDGTWKESYNVTINHYIQPALVKKIKASIV